VLAVEADVVAAPQGLADLEELEEAADAPLEGHPHVLELLADVRHVARDAHAQDDPSLRDAIERADDMGEDHGLAQSGQEHGRAQAHPLGARGHRGEKGERLVAWPRSDGVADPHGVEPARLGALRHGQERARLLTSRHHRLARGDEQAELDGHRDAS